MTGLFQGMRYVLKGFSLITQKGIRPYVVVPLLINTLIFAGGIWLASSQVERWMNHLLPTWLSWLEWLLWPVFIVVIFFAVFYTFTMLANLISAPFNALLAEQVEKHLNGLPSTEFQGFKSIPSLITRTFRSEASKLWYMAKWGVLLVLITIIPGVNVISPLAWTILGAWMLAIEYVDYPMGNHELYFKDELQTLKKHPAQALGFGWILSLITAIPVLNFFAMPVGVAGATALWVDELSKNHRERLNINLC